MSIFIKKSRADVFREYYWMHLSKLMSALCPMKLFKKYIEATKIKESQEKFIFRQICDSKQSFKLKDLDKPISYTEVRDIWLKNLKNIGLEKSHVGLHSLRSGGATAAANFEIIDRLFQKHKMEIRKSQKKICSRKLISPAKCFQKLRFLKLSPYP